MNRFQRARESAGRKVNAPADYLSYSSASLRLTGDAVNRSYVGYLVRVGRLQSVTLVDPDGFLMAKAVTVESVEAVAAERQAKARSGV